MIPCGGEPNTDCEAWEEAEEDPPEREEGRRDVGRTEYVVGVAAGIGGDRGREEDEVCRDNAEGDGGYVEGD